MTAEEMKKEVRTYCLDLIFNSKVEDWSDRNCRYYKDNMIIVLSNNSNTTIYFTVYIYKDNTLQYKVTEIEFKKNTKFWFSSDEAKKIKKKYHEIIKYFDNKKEYDSALETYKLLPIKQLRKNKLKNLNKK